MGLHTVAGCWSQPLQLCVRAQSHASTEDGQGCQWVPLTLLCTEGRWTTDHWKPCSRISVMSQLWSYHQWDGHLPQLCAPSVKKPRCGSVWAYAVLPRGMWVDGCSLFSFLLFSKYLEHLGLQLLYILKSLFLYPSCCTVTLNVLQMNEKPPLKLITIWCLSFSGTTFEVFLTD